MYAVIQTGGKQYRVAVGDRLKVETLVAEPGDSVELDKVLMISDQDNVQIGTPLLEGQSVSAQVVDNGRGEKIKVFKMHRRQGYRRTQGHRQNYTEIEITAIAGQGIADASNSDTSKADTSKADVSNADQDNAPSAEKTVKSDVQANTVESKTGDTTTVDTNPVETAPVETVSQESAEPVHNEQNPVDDLTEINGIGPVISEKLNNLGYTTFAQIAALDETGVAEIEEQLSFKGRIEREDWIKQAIELSK